MKDESGSGAGPDRSRIDASDPGNVQYWAGRLGVAEEELAAAVKAAGPSVQDVADHLARKSAAGRTCVAVRPSRPRYPDPDR